MCNAETCACRGFWQAGYHLLRNGAMNHSCQLHVYIVWQIVMHNWWTVNNKSGRKNVYKLTNIWQKQQKKIDIVIGLICKWCIHFFSTLNLNTEAVGSQRCHPCNAITIEFSSSFSFFSADCPQDFQAGSYSSVVSRMINVSLPCSYLLGQLTTSTRRSKSKRDRDMMMTFGFLNENVSFHMLSGDSSAVFGPRRIQPQDGMNCSAQFDYCIPMT